MAVIIKLFYFFTILASCARSQCYLTQKQHEMNYCWCYVLLSSSMAQHQNTTFGKTVENFIQCTKEATETNPNIVVRNVSKTNPNIVVRNVSASVSETSQLSLSVIDTSQFWPSSLLLPSSCDLLSFSHCTVPNSYTTQLTSFQGLDILATKND